MKTVFCEISKAFDRVWHRALLFKLSQVGISGSLLYWFQSYLTDRKQRVILKKIIYGWSPIKAGVLQDPYLFLSTLMILLKIFN